MGENYVLMVYYSVLSLACIRLSSEGHAGLDNYNIDTEKLILMWTSSSFEQVSKACGYPPPISGASSTLGNWSLP